MLSHTPDIERPEPRWPVIVAALAAVALHFALPPALRPGTPWVVGVGVTTLVIAATVFRHLGMHRQNSWASYGVLAVLAGGLMYGVVMLIIGLMRKTENGTELLSSAAVLWTSNVIVLRPTGCWWKSEMLWPGRATATCSPISLTGFGIIPAPPSCRPPARFSMTECFSTVTAVIRTGR